MALALWRVLRVVVVVGLSDYFWRELGLCCSR